MTTDELIAAACPTLQKLGSRFYFAPETQVRAKELGTDTFRFYFLGRGGVLGDTDASVVASAFAFFEGSLVEKMWNSGREVLDPKAAGREFHGCSAAFGRQHLGEVTGLDAFCAAAEAVIAATDVAGLTLFAGVAALPLAEDLPGRAMQLMTVLRELRGSAHIVALVASGVTPIVAHFLARPDDVTMFGYPELPNPTDTDRANYEAAERLTDRLVRPGYSALDEQTAQRFVEVLGRIDAAVGDAGAPPTR